MLIGYVSDERHVALPDVLLEFENEHGSHEARSRAGGAVHVDLQPGAYTVTLHKPGFGNKRSRIEVAPGRLHAFRLLADGLLGYAWPGCVRAGGRSEFRVHAVEPYHLELFRYGLSKERIKSLGWFDEHGPRAVMQITPDGDYSQTGVAWNQIGYHSKVHHQFVEAPPRPGLHYFHARTNSGLFFSFPWIIAPNRPAASVAVLLSDINGNAYNNFGGRSNYINPAALPERPTVNSRQDLQRYTERDHLVYDRDVYAPLSFDRPAPFQHIDEREQPTDPIEGRNACHLLPAEWRLLAWLEREAIPHDVYAETQLHDGTLRLDDYRTLILGPHPEYWTRKMYDDVKRWVFERGGRLVYLGGNGLNCAVEMGADAMTVRNGDRREIERRGLESRFHLAHESEANLLGVVFTEAGAMTGAPYRALDASHWIFAGTNLLDGALFGTQSLHRRCPGGASGHETDKISPSSPAGVRPLAQGLNPDDGGAHLVCFETPSGGAVFSAGSICYVSSLLVDEAVSKITANVVRKFGESA